MTIMRVNTILDAEPMVRYYYKSEKMIIQKLKEARQINMPRIYNYMDVFDLI